MKNYKVILSYDGTKYQGWQKQESSQNTIQGKIEHILSVMVGKKVEIQGSGRTDAGVHAKMQVFNVCLESELNCSEIQEYMNQYLPEDIVAYSVEYVDARFHARLNAKSKTYMYRVWNSKIPDVFNRRYCYQVEEKLDLLAMQKAARFLEGKHDFKAFCTKKKLKKSTVREIYEINIEKQGEEIQFIYKGNGFLYHMVRILTGTLIEVGKGERKPEDMIEILESLKRENAGFLVPGKGLCLMEVSYEK